jgi:hypothetical protein
MTNQIMLPPNTIARLEALLTQRQAVDAVIEATVATLREALDVPDGWQLRNVHEGFVAPQIAQETPTE